MSFAQVWAKSQDTSFRQRLAVAVMEQCRWTLQIAEASWPGGITSDRYTAMQDLARILRTQVTHAESLTRIALYVLLPWGGYDPDDDSALQTHVASVFAELSGSALPA